MKGWKLLSYILDSDLQHTSYFKGFFYQKMLIISLLVFVSKTIKLTAFPLFDSFLTTQLTLYLHYNSVNVINKCYEILQI